MVQQHDYQKQHWQPAAAARRALTGAAIGLALITIFLIGVKSPDPAWGDLWMLRPLLIVPMAGALGGLINYILLQYHHRFGIHKAIAVVLSVLIFVVGLWLGFVLGLAGTLWH
ncbi:potassium transporter KefB [Pontibacter sp. FD36]|uniref:potassium transporter KefB n=1 Tax=Pontibacter sp. FD36 TaxID=2789860 RepID=UPI0018AA3678|nr:potassium transporter KefB [Pontibacter sp. FD36]MBF8965553.1 potassium transporter KefB [Pontibacter sp. FD36]